MFTYFWERARERERERESERECEQAHEQGRGREGDTESEAGSRLWAVSTDPNAGLELMNGEIMTWAEVGCLTDWATQAPVNTHNIKYTLKRKILIKT